MADSPKDRRYTKEHEWVRLADGEALLGITDFAQEQLGDLVYFDLPEPGAQIRQHAKLGEVESVKAVSEIYAPVSGEVVEVNQRVMESPELVNRDPYGDGWLLKVKPGDPSELDNLLSAEEYDALVATAAGEQH
ncbi:MAG TPA: glycine cleavage system protein GcvH [Dehalococcoidia bacterium]|nr:glycine cleavage system protein GcvH [Dehalococcoidia bacterium]